MIRRFLDLMIILIHFSSIFLFLEFATFFFSFFLLSGDSLNISSLFIVCKLVFITFLCRFNFLFGMVDVKSIAKL